MKWLWKYLRVHMHVLTKHGNTALYKAFPDMTAGWLYHMQTKKPWVHYASQSCGKTIPGAIYVALAHLFGTISKRPSLSAARYISFHEDKCTVYWRCHACHTELFFWPYRYYSLEAFENLLFLVWAQLLIPLVVLDMAPFRQDCSPFHLLRQHWKRAQQESWNGFGIDSAFPWHSC